VGESITRDEAVTTTADTIRFVVFGCRGQRTIGCWLTKGGDVGETMAMRCPAAMDKRINQPPDSS